MTDPGQLVVRADASPTMGTGHVMRCLALAHEWRARGGSVVVASAQLTASVKERLRRERIQVVAVEEAVEATANVVEQLNAQWVVLDVGAAAPQHLAHIEGPATLVLDDQGGVFPEPPDLLVNQNVQAHSVDYPGLPPGVALRGLDYVLLRDEFLLPAEQCPIADRQLAPPEEMSPLAVSVLLVMGGTDASRQLPTYCQALVGLAEGGVIGSLHVVASAKHPEIEMLNEMTQGHPQVNLWKDPPNMAAVMREADLAVTAGGSSVWELAFLGVPALVGSAAAMEQETLDGLEATGMFRVLGNMGSCPPHVVADAVKDAAGDRQWRSETAERVQRLVDGQGRSRVIEAMLR